MRAALAARGMDVDEVWVQSMVRACREEGGHKSDEDLELEVYFQYLYCDLRTAAKATARLPAGIDAWEDRVLQGKFVLQIEALEQIGDETAIKDLRTLKLLLTDGARDVAAFELSRVVDLEPSTPLGAKLFLQDPRVRRGVLLLAPDCAKFLGGMVCRAKETEKSDLLQLAEKNETDPPPDATSRIRLRYEEEEEEDESDDAPASRRKLETYALLWDFGSTPAPVTARVWAYVSAVKKYFWSSKRHRYILVVTLMDSSATLDAVFSEELLAHLLGTSSSSEVHHLDEARQAAARERVQARLESFEGMMELCKAVPPATSSPTNAKLDALPHILACHEAPAADVPAIQSMLEEAAAGKKRGDHHNV
ncbi:hypothetical protein CTAYLR_009032 [Chrysophaeum taylorii]|uniref:RecQ-mediated genome instability protein 1 n=1 Tax=Chrysophaeum taylorii TaxID=2483200 RepID=A0AAD7UFZ6_9STRA|nr:hypothetical protein CTAYLR_009032 [Chrysophaeum taylorii]